MAGYEETSLKKTNFILMERGMRITTFQNLSKYRVLVIVLAGTITIFVCRTVLAARITIPRLFDLFNAITITGSFGILISRHRNLNRQDWWIAVLLGCTVGVGMQFASLYSPYPFFGVVRDQTGQAVLRGLFTMIAVLAGLSIMHNGGPVQFHLATGNWRRSWSSIVLGLLTGLPLAVLNVIALQATYARATAWQDPAAAVMDALQPGIVEEIVFRFALWGLCWLALSDSLPAQSARLSGLITLFVHSYAHFSDEFVDSPLLALTVGMAIAVVWGLPPYILARHKGLEGAISFHWLQDAARFLAGF